MLDKLRQNPDLCCSSKTPYIVPEPAHTKVNRGFLFLLVIFRESTQTSGLPDRRMWAPGSENTELHARKDSPE